MRTIAGLLVAAASWADAGSAAEPYGVRRGDACMNHCSLERDESGQMTVLCGCLEKKYPGQDSFFGLRGRAPTKFGAEVSRRMRGAGTPDLKAVYDNACAGPVRDARTHPRPANELLSLAPLAERPLCECVLNRVHFPVKRDCDVTKAGQTICRYELSVTSSDRTGPLRDPTLYDYQACVAARVNYRPPESCPDQICKDQPRECPFGQELVNVADSEACCPAYECREGEVR